MAKPVSREQYLESSRLWFPADSDAPFSELNLIRADHRVRHPNPLEPPHKVLAASAPEIVVESWLSSPWLKDATGESDENTLRQKTASLAEAVNRTMYAATAHPLERGIWLAVRPPASEPRRNLTYGLGSTLTPDQVVGFASANQNIPGNSAERAETRSLFPERVRAELSDVDVIPEAQGKGISVALGYAALGLFRPNQVATTRVASANESLIDWLKQFGFEAAGVEPRTDLLYGYTIEETRLAADSVGNVRRRMEIAYNWLTEAVPLPHSIDNK